MKRPRTHYTKVGDIHIAYQVFGEGPVDLLWAQGWATHIEYAWESPDYARFLTKLGRFARVIFFDKRGVGMSDRDVGYPTLEERAQDVTAVLDAAGPDRVAGHIPGAALRMLPGEDHIVWYGDQESIIREISGFVTGTAVARPGARALLTLLFVDIVNSTGHLSRMGDDRWRGVLEQLDHVAGRRIAALGGTRIKATGDGYLISFRGPTSALECAMALREDMARLGLEGRFGLHAGECEVTAGDVSGLAVHAAARIMDNAAPGEILLSQTARDLALGAPVAFSDRGEADLRGLSGKWRLHCVAG
jgi:class 3 adenylate cyclase